MTPPKNVMQFNSKKILQKAASSPVNDLWASAAKVQPSRSLPRSSSVFVAVHRHTASAGLEEQPPSDDLVLPIPFVSFCPEASSRTARIDDSATTVKRGLPTKPWNQVGRSGTAKASRNRSMSVPTASTALAAFADGTSSNQSTSLSRATKESSLSASARRRSEGAPPPQRRESKPKFELEVKQAPKQAPSSSRATKSASEPQTPRFTGRPVDRNLPTDNPPDDGSFRFAASPGQKLKSPTSNSSTQNQELPRGTRFALDAKRSRSIGLDPNKQPSRRAMSPPAISTQKRSVDFPRRSSSMVMRKPGISVTSTPGSRSASPFDRQPTQKLRRKPSVHSSPASPVTPSVSVISPKPPVLSLDVSSCIHSNSPSRPSSARRPSTPVPLRVSISPAKARSSDDSTSAASKPQLLFQPIEKEQPPPAKAPPPDTWFKGFFLRPDGPRLRLVCPRCEEPTGRTDAPGCMLDCHDVLCHACCEALLRGGQTICCPCCRRDTPLAGRTLAQLAIPRVVSALLEIKREELYAAPLEATLEAAGAVCPVCLEVIGAGRLPILLRCGHNLCDDCSVLVQARASAEAHVECPECRQLTPHGADSVNLVLMYVVAQLRMLKEKGLADSRALS